MNLVKTSALSAIQTLVKILAGLVIVKYVAVQIGPSGMGMLGQLQNFVAIVTGIAVSVSSTGVVKYGAEYHQSLALKNQLYSTAWWLSCALCIMLAVPMLLCSEILADITLHDKSLTFLFQIFVYLIKQ
mgnify:FL=1